ncbi:MAG: hypothetical protein N2441_00505 [Rhodocyclaceae bacterium]|nr:hypothetical protein [Rhodocyclaceae bacterium]
MIQYGMAMALAMLLAACATTPVGPEVMALPGTGRTFEEFRADDQACRAYALQQIGGQARREDINQQAIGKAAVGATVGAVAGAAIGGRDSAGVGAGLGLIVGSATAAESAHAATRGSQRQYDQAYIQCMYAKGHRVPVSGVYTAQPEATTRVIPPPPAGSPPPPPPR